MELKEYGQRLKENCGKVIIGKEEAIEKVIVCFLCGGHILLEDLPGTGKTMLLRSFAKSLGGSFKRIQFTPDLLPSDLTGIHIYDKKSEEFRFRPGPLFANLVLADEINRATPRTQSALLEAMAEKQVTVDGETYPMEDIFLIMASQNPLESHGTFPLPEAQLDRFFMRLSLGYMEHDEELRVLLGKDSSEILEGLGSVVTPEDTLAAQKAAGEVEITRDLADYILSLAEATRKDSRIRVGVSTRGALALFRAAKALAGLRGRSYALPEDVRELAVCTLSHRLTLAGNPKPGAAEALIAELCEKLPVPTEAAAGENA